MAGSAVRGCRNFLQQAGGLSDVRLCRQLFSLAFAARRDVTEGQAQGPLSSFPGCGSPRRCISINAAGIGERKTALEEFEEDEADFIKPKFLIEDEGVNVVATRGVNIMHDPWWNKGTAFSEAERDRLALRGLLPPRVTTMEDQILRIMEDYRTRNTNALGRWRMLRSLHERNETLYYTILCNNVARMAPIIYTPTVGEACEKYSELFRRSRGMYFSAKDLPEFHAMVHNWPSEHVDVVCVTDGSRVLGLGDLGIQGMGISIGKLDLYVAAGGIHPSRILPVAIDVGTDNETLRQDPFYLGLNQPRLQGEEYFRVVDGFMEAIFNRWPRCLVQFEDFQTRYAKRLLNRYKGIYRVFNDDIQGTASVALAGLLSAFSAQGGELRKKKVLIAGAGSAGVGVASVLARAMAQESEGFGGATGFENIYMLDKDGLITESRKMPDDVMLFAKRHSTENGIREGLSLEETIRLIKPDALLGLSTVGGLFSENVLKAMKDSTERPIVMPLSNPTANAECTAKEVFSVVGAQAIFASGSPFDDVSLPGGNIGHANQGNNMYLFPGRSGVLSVTPHGTLSLAHQATLAVAGQL
mmetsp:Transcript_522/g.1864  ORF Transcript_522/g.1864 Transcript_522/m.1864 type:complete len:584 (+) Transcript_522:72-1823(+)